MTKKDSFKHAVLNSGREKIMHAGIWVFEEQVRERETEVPGTKAVLYHLNDFWTESFKTSPKG